MISQETEHGGSSATIASTTVLTRASPRVLRCNPAASNINISLYDTSLAPVMTRAEGFARHVIVNLSATRTVRVVSGLTTILTVSTQSVGVLWIKEAATNSWLGKQYTLNGSRTYTSGAAAAPTEPPEAETFDPFCFVGSDCEYAEVEPLDGEEDRALVMAPFFQNPCVAASNLNREPIRAADIVMPSKVVVRVLADDFEADPLHPLAATTLSDAFYEAFYNNGAPRLLEYVGTISGNSRHPHHVRRVGDPAGPWDWNLEALDVVRHLWALTVPYSTGGVTYDLKFRMVMEHTVEVEPVLVPGEADYTASTLSQQASDNSINDSADQLLAEGFEAGMRVEVSGFTGGGYNGTGRLTSVTAGKMILADTTGSMANDASGESVTITVVGGSQNNAEHGARGAIFSLYILTNELLPAFVDGGNHQATGFSAVNAFTLNDPFIWGSADGVAGGDDADKGAHPHMVAIAHKPMTWHSPCGSNPVPLLDREFVFGEEPGRNREYAYEVPNCSPWTTAPIEKCIPCADNDGILGNCVFGWSAAGEMIAWAMTLGGDIPTSVMPEGTVLENGLGVGRTYLKPKRPGWNEETGEYTPDEGSSIVLSICGPESDDDWPAQDLSPCHGHPDEPFEGVGGSHRCFKTGATDSATRCCVSIEAGANAKAVEKCVKTTTTYGAFTGSECENLGDVCENVGTFTTQFELPVDDYSFAPNSDQATRILTWKRYRPDPDHVTFDYTYDDADVGDLIEEVGGFSTTAVAITVDAVAIETATAVMLYEPAGASYRDTSISAECGACLTKSHGLLGRASVNGSDELTGYGGLLTPDTGTNADLEIVYYEAGVREVLASAAITNNANQVDMSFEVNGTRLTLTWEIGGVTESLQVHDCRIADGGHPGVYTESAVSGASFGLLAIEDQTIEYLSVDAQIAPDDITVDFPAELMAGYGLCEAVTNPTCGDCCEPAHCNCVTSAQAMTRIESSQKAGAGDISLPDYDGETDGDNPTVCGGGNPHLACESEFCPGGDLPCGKCPPAFAGLTLCVTRCRDADDEYAEPNMCGGITEWTWTDLVCA